MCEKNSGPIGIWFSYEKDWSTDTPYNVLGPWEHDAQWEKPDTEDHIVCDFIYMKYPEWTSL